MNDLQAFAQLVSTLAPWRAHLIFVGGWCHRLHAQHERATKLEQEYLFTRDSDLLFGHDAPREGQIGQALKENGFVEQLHGDHRPPASHYTLGSEDQGFYAEFLTPLIGPATRRDGKPNATATIAGVSAQKVRYLEVLQADPWVVSIGNDSVFPLDVRTDVRVAHPLRFMVQKFLIKESRIPRKQAQDVLYVYETLQLFSSCLDEFRKEWAERVAPSMPAQWVNTILREWQATFGDKSGPLLTTAASMATERPGGLSARQMQLVLRLGYQRIFA